MAARRRKAEGLFRGGAVKEAVAQLRQVCRDDPGDPEGPLDLAVALGHAGDPAGARRTLDELLARQLPGATRARVTSALADLLMRAGRDDEARAALGTLLTLPTDDGLKRERHRPAAGARDPRLGPPLRPALVRPEPEGHRRRAPPAAAARGRGRRARRRPRPVPPRPPAPPARPAARRRCRGCGAAAALPLPDERFRRENQRLLGHAAHQAGEPGLAAATFRALRDDPTTPETLRLEAEDMLARVEFDRASGLGPRRGAERPPLAQARPAAGWPAAHATARRLCYIDEVLVTGATGFLGGHVARALRGVASACARWSAPDATLRP